MRIVPRREREKHRDGAELVFERPRCQGSRSAMRHSLRALATAGPLLTVMALAPPSSGQQAGGMLRIGHFTSPASVSMLEESTAAVNRPMMGVFNNLVMFKQDELQNTPE